MKGSAVRIRASASPICREYVGTGSARAARHLEHMPARANSMTGTVTGEAGLEVGSSEPSALVSATGETVYPFIAVAGGLSLRMGGREPDDQPAPRYPITARHAQGLELVCGCLYAPVTWFGPTGGQCSPSSPLLSVFL